MDQAFNVLATPEAKFYHTGNHGIVLFPNMSLPCILPSSWLLAALRINSSTFPTELAGNVRKDLFQSVHFLGFLHIRTIR